MKRKAAVKRYRILKEGEVIKPGDETNLNGKWRLMVSSGQAVNSKDSDAMPEGHYRRPISTKAKRK